MKPSLLAALIVAVAVPAAWADEVTLTNGRKITGLHRKEGAPAGKVVVEVPLGTIILDANDVSSVSPGRTDLHRFEEQRAAIEQSAKASDWFELARWCKERGITRHVTALCQKVVALDAEHAGARRELGHEKIGGKWLNFEQAQEAKGLALYEGNWMTLAEKEAQDELQKKRRLEAKQRALALKAEQDKKKEEERQRRLKAAEEHRAWMSQQLAGLDGYFYRPDWFWPAYFRPYPWASYVRSRRVFQEGWRYNGGGGGLSPSFDVMRFIPDPFKR